MKDDVRTYVRSCLACQKTKAFPAHPAGLLQPIPPSSEPWEEVTADFITQLPPSLDLDAILVVVDCFTKRAHFIPTTSDVTAETTAHLYLENVWKHHGWPKKIISIRC
jgi:hypothetical protein